MCYLDIYSKKSFDMYEDVLMYIHPSWTYAWFFCCIACVCVFFLREQINISSVAFFFSSSYCFFNPLSACLVPTVLAATEVEVARGVF